MSNWKRSEYIDQLFESVECVVDVMIKGEEKYRNNDWQDPASPNGTVQNHISHASDHIDEFAANESYKHNLEHLSHAATRSLMALQLFLERKNG